MERLRLLNSRLVDLLGHPSEPDRLGDLLGGGEGGGDSGDRLGLLNSRLVDLLGHPSVPGRLSDLLGAGDGGSGGRLRCRDVVENDPTRRGAVDLRRPVGREWLAMSLEVREGCCGRRCDNSDEMSVCGDERQHQG